MPVHDGPEFSSTGVRILSTVVHLFGTSVVSGCLVKRVALEDLLYSKAAWRTLTITRSLILLILVDSLAFIILTSLLVQGIGLETSYVSCNLGILGCIGLYTSSKVLIYSFLTERVWVVWSSLTTNSAMGSSMNHRSELSRRLHSPVYILCIASMTLYGLCFVAALMFRIAYRRSSDGECVIGLGLKASLPLLSFDLYITVLLTSLFVWPLRAHTMAPQLRSLARRTLMASLVALATSAINIGVLTSMHGHQLGWVCLASCGSDVAINALVLDMVTESRLQKYVRELRQKGSDPFEGSRTAPPERDPPRPPPPPFSPTARQGMDTYVESAKVASGMTSSLQFHVTQITEVCVDSETNGGEGDLEVVDEKVGLGDVQTIEAWRNVSELRSNPYASPSPYSPPEALHPPVPPPISLTLPLTPPSPTLSRPALHPKKSSKPFAIFDVPPEQLQAHHLPPFSDLEFAASSPSLPLASPTAPRPALRSVASVLSLGGGGSGRSRSMTGRSGSSMSSLGQVRNEGHGGGPHSRSSSGETVIELEEMGGDVEEGYGGKVGKEGGFSEN